jgi:hypothetical protein
MNSQAAILIAVLAVLAALAALALWLRERAARKAQRSVLDERNVYEPLFADLWSDEMHRRLAALFVAQRVAKTSAAARGLAPVLISFVRRRTAASTDETESFEDLRLALTILASKAIRRAQRASGQKIDLGGVNFRAAVLAGADLRGFRLAQCKFDRCRLSGADLRDADLSGASLVGADLAGADMRGADLTESDLSDADFTGSRVDLANFTNANVAGAILTEARGLIQEQLDVAFGDSGTAVPERLRFAAGRAQRLRGRVG